jgi:hypothetical protein
MTRNPLTRCRLRRVDAWIRNAATLVVATGVFAACGPVSDAPDNPAAPADAYIVSASSPGGAPVLASQLAEVRALTAKYHDFQASQDAGYTAIVSGCVQNPPIGAMGIHYLNPLYVDAAVTPLLPEVVIYEPEKSGKLRFVGVEYIIPYAILPETAQPPVLFGEEFLHNPGNQLWMMHVWIGRHNPDGLLATWNPQVSCAFAS